MFNSYSDSVSGNTNLPKIVSWARDILADTNQFPILDPPRIEQGKLPKELFELYRGPNADVATPNASIHTVGGTERFIAINYLPGSIFRFSLFIGGKDFSIPPDGVRMWKKLEDGVFVSLDWPGR